MQRDSSTPAPNPTLIQRIFYPTGTSAYSVFMEYFRVIFTAVLIAIVFRTFVASPYKIPSSSMVPTLLIGDYLFVSKYIYGIPIPFSGGERWHETSPHRGDVVVFETSLNGTPTENYIKRVIGLPGDMVSYQHKQLFINGQPIQLDDAGKDVYANTHETITAARYIEHLGDIEHSIILRADRPGQDVAPMRVPPDHYIVMGDNRDSSYDSRYWHYPSWSFVDKHDIVGRAEFIFWSWDQHFKPRFSRMFTTLHPKPEK